MFIWKWEMKIQMSQKALSHKRAQYKSKISIKKERNFEIKTHWHLNPLIYKDWRKYKKYINYCYKQRRGKKKNPSCSREREKILAIYSKFCCFAASSYDHFSGAEMSGWKNFNTTFVTLSPVFIHFFLIFEIMVVYQCVA